MTGSGRKKVCLKIPCAERHRARRKWVESFTPLRSIFIFFSRDRMVFMRERTSQTKSCIEITLWRKITTPLMGFVGQYYAVSFMKNTFLPDVWDQKNSSNFSPKQKELFNIFLIGDRRWCLMKFLLEKWGFCKILSVEDQFIGSSVKIAYN